MKVVELLIIGAGAAGISAAKAAAEAGCQDILLVDIREKPGGVLNQCAHNGFGWGLNGAQYIEYLLREFPQAVELWMRTMVLSISADKTAVLSGEERGRFTVSFSHLILATGCLEIPLGSLPIGGSRPQGIYTAGQMQERLNNWSLVPPGPVVILGSGDIGLIMAESLSERGLDVTLVEQQAHCGGMVRNQKCLEKGNVHLLCTTTIQDVLGEKQITGIRLSGGKTLPCHTLLIAAGLRPDTALIDKLGNPGWLTLCGNCKTIHAMIESVIKEGTQAGISAWEKIRGNL